MHRGGGRGRARGCSGGGGVTVGPDTKAEGVGGTAGGDLQVWGEGELLTKAEDDALQLFLHVLNTEAHEGRLPQQPLLSL